MCIFEPCKCIFQLVYWADYTEETVLDEDGVKLVPSSTNGRGWLPDLDSNQDKVNQNHLCYHYTIRQNAGELSPQRHLIYTGNGKSQAEIGKIFNGFPLPAWPGGRGSPATALSSARIFPADIRLSTLPTVRFSASSAESR